MREHKKILRSTSLLLSVLMIYFPVNSALFSANAAWDDAVSNSPTDIAQRAADARESGLSGQSTAIGLSDQFKNSGGLTDETISNQIGEFNYETSSNSAYRVDPDDSPYSESPAFDTDDAKSIYSDGEGLDAAGDKTKNSLWSDSKSWSDLSATEMDESGMTGSLQGAAYQILVEKNSVGTADLSNDSILVGERDSNGNYIRDSNGNILNAGINGMIEDSTDVSNELLQDCVTTTTYERINDASATIPDLQQCTNVQHGNFDCKVKHNYKASIIEHSSGPYNIAPCTDADNCSNVWIGDTENNKFAGYCDIYENQTSFVVTNTDAITKVTFDRALFDDYLQVWVAFDVPLKDMDKIGGITQYEHQWSNVTNKGYLELRDKIPLKSKVLGQKIWESQSWFPPEKARSWGSSNPNLSCELDKSWVVNPDLDLTSLIKSQPNGTVVTLKTRISVAGYGEGYGRLRIEYDPEKTVFEDDWTPDECIDSMGSLVDGAAKGQATCTSMPNLNDEGCAVLNGITICEDDFKEMSQADALGISPLCREVKVQGNIDFFHGKVDCYTNAQGEEVCPVVDNNLDEEDYNSCQALKDDPTCKFVSSECVASGEEGGCYQTDSVYDCGETVDIFDMKETTTTTCPGAVSCMGSECIDLQKETSTDFAKANALLNTAQMMVQDMSCTGQEQNEDGSYSSIGTEDVECTVFAGEASECKKALGQDCCEKPANINVGDYLTLIMATPKIDAAIVSLGNESVINNSYQVLREPVMQGWSAVTEPFASYFDGVSSSIDAIGDTVSTAVDTLVDELIEQSKSLLADVLQDMGVGTGLNEAGAQAGAQAVNTAAQNAANSAVNLVVSSANVVMWVYTAYVVSEMLISVIYACEESEFELNAKRANEACAYVGDYCKEELPFGGCLEKRQAYCCYSSPLAQIINNQIKKENPQLGLSFGDPKSPDCEGITIDQISELDWTKIDLSEWTALLTVHDLLPSSDIDLDSLTGAGSVFNFDGAVKGSDEDRMNSAERAVARVAPVDGNGDPIYAKTDASGNIITNADGTPKFILSLSLDDNGYPICDNLDDECLNAKRYLGLDVDEARIKASGLVPINYGE